MRAAVIDMGTNTFNLLIGELYENSLRTLYSERVFVKIGKGGISNGKLTEKAILRAKSALEKYSSTISRFNTKEVRVTATSAIRSASNASILLSQVKNELGFEIAVINGKQEAELIYKGVKTAIDLGKHPSLIADIGGGSVEFIIANKDKIFWRDSYEIGAQRLFDRFHNNDPITTNEQHHLQSYLESELEDLSQQIYKHQPQMLIGCAGTFSTIKAIHCLQKGTLDLISKTDYPMEIPAYLAIHEELLSKNLKERKAIPGMLEERADMIVVASCIVSFLLENYAFRGIKITSAALKDGLLWETLNHTDDKLDFL